MKITKIGIGGWFQRTTLQLSEIHEFLLTGESRLELDSKQLQKLRTNMNMQEITYGIDGLEYLEIYTHEEIVFRIFEDGLIVLNYNKAIQKEELKDKIQILTDYYENKLSPALAYLFSLGAPIPKELANIKTVYPYFVVFDNAKKEDLELFLDSLVGKLETKKYFHFNGKVIEILRGDKYYFINNISNKSINKLEESINRYIEEKIFLREFKGQLHHYLNLHRIMWERIDQVKAVGSIKGTDISTSKNKIAGYEKTINLIEARIYQMDTYLHTRDNISKIDPRLQDFTDIIDYRYETLGHTLSYIKHIWTMTKNYVEQSFKLFSDLESKANSSSIKDLTVITSMSLGSTLIGYFTTAKAPVFSSFGFLYFFILAFIGWGVNAGMKKIAKNKSYKISEVKYDKDIK